MGKYIKTMFDDSALMKDIQRAECGLGRKILLTMSEKTQKYLENQLVMPTFSEIRLDTPDEFLTQYNGYKVLKDDSLDLGEVKILAEIK